MNSGIQGASMKELIKQKLAHGEVADPERETTYEQEISEALVDEGYAPTQCEVFELFTIHRTTKKSGM